MMGHSSKNCVLVHSADPAVAPKSAPLRLWEGMSDLLSELFLGSGSDRGQSPVECGDFSLYSYVPTSVSPTGPSSQALGPASQAQGSTSQAFGLAGWTSGLASWVLDQAGWLDLRPGWLGLGSGWLGLWPGWMALKGGQVDGQKTGCELSGRWTKDYLMILSMF